MSKISVLMPAYNEGTNLRANIEKVRATLEDMLETSCKEWANDYEIVVVDDGSTDATKREIENALARCPKLKAVTHTTNRGKCAALRSAFKHSDGDYVFFLDSDLEIDPAYMESLFLELQKEGCDGMLGSKQQGDRKHYPLLRRLASRCFSAFVSFLLPLPVRDTQTGIKLFRRELLERVFDCMLVRRYAFDVELVALAVRNGFSVKETPVSVNFSGRKGSMTLFTIYNMAIDILAIYYRLRVLCYYDNWVPKKKDFKPFVSIVIAVKHDNPYLRQSMACCLKQDYPKDRYEIIVLPDDPIPSCDNLVRIIPTGSELPAIKRNLGAREAKGEIVAFLDDDAYPQENWLSEMAGNFGDPLIAGVGGPGTTPPDDSFWQRVGGSVYESRMMSGGFVYRYLVDRRRTVDDYPTCNLAIRKSVFQEAGGFQTNFWPGEDTELCLSITKKLERTIIYDPLVEVCHHRRHLFRGHFKQLTQYALHRGYFVKKFPETSLKLSYFLPSLFLLGVIGGLACMAVPALFPLSEIFLGVMLIYFVLSFVAAFLARPRLTPLTVLGVFLSHLAYGYYFLVGLISSRLRKEEEYHASLARKNAERNV